MVIQMTNDENIIEIFMNTEEIGKNKCIPLSDKDYDKIKDYGDVRITIIRNNTKAQLGIP
ncbi:MAG TPA: hypothetical protein VIZ62_07205 [Nitrososphaeraceae archaeon]|jgi:phosphoheptose isomerase